MTLRSARPTSDLEIALITANRQRGSSFLAAVLDGIEGLVDTARGSPLKEQKLGARAALRRLKTLFDEVDSILAITLPEELES